MKENIRENIRENIKQNKQFYFVIIATMIAQAIRYFPFKFGGWNQIMLSFSYRYGFIQRGFLGSILDIISTVFHIPWGYMRYIYGIFSVGFYSVLYLYIVYKALEKEKQSDVGFFLKGLTLAFYMGPGWVANYSNFGLTDIWVQMCSIYAVYLLAKNKHAWLSIVVCCVGVLIYPAYVFTYWNLVLVFGFYLAFMASKKLNRKHLIILVLNLLCVGTVFMYTQFFAHVKPGITMDYIVERTAEFVDKTPEEVAKNHSGTIQDFIFKDMPTDGKIGNEDVDVSGAEVVSEEQGIANKIFGGWTFYIFSFGLLLVAMAILFVPFFVEIFRYWGLVAQNAKKQGTKLYWLYALFPLGSLTVVPCYILLNDYGRYTNGAFIYEFGIIWLMNRVRDEHVVQATEEYVKRVWANKAYYIFLVCYAAINGTFHQNLINELVSTVETYLWKVIALF